jgi:hypothetical protein
VNRQNIVRTPFVGWIYGRMSEVANTALPAMLISPLPFDVR